MLKSIDLLFGETTSHLISKWRALFNMSPKIINMLEIDLAYKKHEEKFLNVGNSIKCEENMKYWKKKKLFYFFQYLKNSKKIQSTFHQYKKLHSTPPCHGARTCKVSRKYIKMRFRVTVWKLNMTDGQTDRQTNVQMDGWGALQYLPSRAFGAVGDKYV